MMTDLSIYEAFKETVNKYPKDLALFYQGKKVTFSNLLKRVDKMASILSNNLNIKENDVVLVSQPNIPEVVVLFYAINKIGAISHFIHPFTPYQKVMEIMEKTNTKVAFLFEQRIAKEVEEYRKTDKKIYVTRIEDDLPLFKKVFYHFFMNFKIRKKLSKDKGFNYVYKLKAIKKESLIIKTNQHPYSVLLSSGSTTGEPKTICLNDSSFNYIAMHSDTFMSLTKEELRGQKMLSVLPSFHGFGLCMTMHAPLVNGFASILIPRFRVKKVAKIINKIKPTAICGVPTIYEKLINESTFINSKNLKYLHACFCGGDVLSKDLINEFNEIMRKNHSSCRLLQGYGLSEALAVNSLNTLKDNKDGSLGKPIPDTIIKIVDENNNELPINEVGEIIIKSPATMVCYFQDEKATNKCLINGYLHTGDIGYLDEDGYLYFVSRKKRVVKVSGVAVFPSEVEELIKSLKEVDDCAAIGIPHDKLQNSIKVFVVVNKNHFDLKEKILDLCRKHLIKWSIPTEIEFVEKLPLTMLGKVDYLTLQEEENKKRIL